MDASFTLDDPEARPDTWPGAMVGNDMLNADDAARFVAS
jgi:hypothetical protein